MEQSDARVCRACGRVWRRGSGRPTLVGLLIRRRLRRLGLRNRWTAARGSRRCPSCLTRGSVAPQYRLSPAEAVVDQDPAARTHSLR